MTGRPFDDAPVADSDNMLTSGATYAAYSNVLLVADNKIKAWSGVDQTDDAKSALGIVNVAVLTGVLPAGNTTLGLTDSHVTDDVTIEVYTDKYGVAPKSVTVANNTVSMVFDEQEADLNVRVDLGNVTWTTPVQPTDQGDMRKANYDAQGEVATAGGIPSYVDQKIADAAGAVQSVNGKTGVVELVADDVGALSSTDGGTVEGSVVVKPTGSIGLAMHSDGGGSSIVAGNSRTGVNMIFAPQSGGDPASVQFVGGMGDTIRMIGIGTPVENYDAVNKEYVDTTAATLREAIAATANIVVVDTRPDTPDANTMYYVGTTSPYHVWLYTTSWYDMGTTDVNLENYAKSDLSNVTGDVFKQKAVDSGIQFPTFEWTTLDVDRSSRFTINSSGLMKINSNLYFFEADVTYSYLLSKQTSGTIMTVNSMPSSSRTGVEALSVYQSAGDKKIIGCYYSPQTKKINFESNSGVAANDRFVVSGILAV